MNATTTPNPATNGMTPSVPTAAELVKSYPTALKAELLVELIRERLAAEPDFPFVGVQSKDGERLGLFLKYDPQTAEADELYVGLPHEFRLAVMKSELDFWNGDAYTPEEMFALIKEESRKAQ